MEGLALPMGHRVDKDLQGDGHAGDLSNGVGQRTGWSFHCKHVGNTMNHPSYEEDQKMDVGNEEVGLRQRVDGTKEQEGIDVFHVIAVGSSSPFHIRISLMVHQSAMSHCILWVGKGLFAESLLPGDEGQCVHLQDEQRAVEGEASEDGAVHVLPRGSDCRQ